MMETLTRSWVDEASPAPQGTASRSPVRYVVWLAARQPGTLAATVFFGVLWMAAEALLPALVGRTVDAGIGDARGGALTVYLTLVLAAGVVGAVAEVLRHRAATLSWIAAAFRTVDLVSAKGIRLGRYAGGTNASAEAATIQAFDIWSIGNAVSALGRGVGSLAAIVVITVFLLSSSLRLGLIVVVGLPILVFGALPLLRPVRRHRNEQRDADSALTETVRDVLLGLRTLRAIGGEPVVFARFTARSRRLAATGLRVVGAESVVDVLQVLVPGLFLVIIMSVAVSLVGDRQISPGELVAFYGYTVFLAVPLTMLGDVAQTFTRGLVAAGRVLRFLDMAEGPPDGARPVIAGELPEPVCPPLAMGPAGEVVDHESGLGFQPGETVGVAVADRMAGDAFLRPFSSAASDPADGNVRSVERFGPGDVLVSADQDWIFSGTLRECVDPVGTAGAEELRRALEVSCLDDVVSSLPDGLDGRVDERGRSLSGGERQRVRLARAVLADRHVLVLVEPTNAVDTHTESEIINRLMLARHNRITVILTGSPVVLQRMHRVVLLSRGGHVTSGTHRELLATNAVYRELF